MAEQKLFTFSFIDFGSQDFVRDENDNVVKKQFDSYESADDFIMSRGLEEFDWTNGGTRKWCWEAEDGEDVP